MKIGIKIFPEDINYAKRISKHCDFFEVMAKPKSDFRALKKLKKPFTIHTIHSHWGFNPANPVKNAEINKMGTDTAAKAADILGADVIVVHPGYKETRKCSLKNAIRYLRRLDDRFIIENLPYRSGNGQVNVGSSAYQLRKVLRATGKSMCLDFPHAAEYAHRKGIYYVDFIKRLLKLKPLYFHISDTRIQNRKDLHLHMKEGNLRLKYLENLIPEPENSRLLIETAHEYMKQHKDIDFLRQDSR